MSGLSNSRQGEEKDSLAEIQEQIQQSGINTAEETQSQTNEHYCNYENHKQLEN